MGCNGIKCNANISLFDVSESFWNTLKAKQERYCFRMVCL